EGEAVQDFYWTTFERTLFDHDPTFAFSRSDTILDKISPASKRFRLDRLINGSRATTTRLFLDTTLRAAARYNWSPQNPRLPNAYEIGGYVGNTIAHELGHQFGLFDDYSAANPGGRSRFNVMFTGFNPDLDAYQETMLAFAFDRPDQQE